MDIKIKRLTADKITFSVKPENLDHELVGWNIDHIEYDEGSITFVVFEDNEERLDHAFTLEIDHGNIRSIFKTENPAITFNEVFDEVLKYEEKHDIQLNDSVVYFHPTNNAFYIELSEA